MQATPEPTPGPEAHPGIKPEILRIVPPPNTADPPFHVLSGLFSRLQTEKKPDRRRQYIVAFFELWRTQVGYDLYPAMRLLLPHKDKERAVYNLKEKSIGKIYSVLLNIDGKDNSVRPPQPYPDADRMQNWKKPATDNEKKHSKAITGDFPSIVQDVVRKRSTVLKGMLTVGQVNEVLDQLTQCGGKFDKQAEVYKTILNGCTPEGQRWIVSIILKDMVISTTELTVFKYFHPDAQALFDTCSDLKKVVHELWDPERRLTSDDIVIKLFQPFAPMLCKRPTRLEDAVKELTRFQGGRFLMEEKLDGERIQLHKRGDSYFYCSRKGKDYTYLYGSHPGASGACVTPFIADCFNEKDCDLILDGELLVYDPLSDRYLKFGTLKTAALDKSNRIDKPHPIFKIFDLLYYNGHSFVDRSTEFRKKMMKEAITEIKGRIEFAACDYATTVQEVRARVEQIVMDQGEGLVLKHLNAKYVLNGRNSDWVKVKPEYMDSMGETVDILVVAGSYGTGKRSGGVSSIICAVLDDTSNTDAETPQYRTFVRVGTGLSYTEYVGIREKNWKPWPPGGPAFLKTSLKGKDDKGDLYLEPEDSFILKIKAAEIVQSDQYHMGFTMRFPRATAIRDDKTVDDCMRATEVYDAMRSDRKRKGPSADMQVTVKKKRKVLTKKAIMDSYRGVKNVKVESDLFEGMSFVVLTEKSTDKENKSAIEVLIQAHGGDRTQKLPAGRRDVIAIYDGEKRTASVGDFIKKDLDVVRSKWLLDSVAAGTKVPLQKLYFFSAGPESQSSDAYHLGEEIVDEPEQSMVLVKDDADIKAEYGKWAGFHIGDAAQKPKAEEDVSDTESEDEPEDPVAAAAESATEDEEDSWDVLAEGVEDLTIEDDEDMVVVEHGAKKPVEDVMMGEPGAMEYEDDPARMFRHMCFYLDTPDNAKANGLSFHPGKASALIKSFAEISKIITERAGTIVPLDDPKLTHVILDPKDRTRRLDLRKLTQNGPKLRRMVTTLWITSSVEEESLQDEEEFQP